MPAERYYLPQQLNQGDAIILTDTEFHHLTNVMRSKVGDEIEVVDGCGHLATGTIENIEKKKATLRVTTVTFYPKPPKSVVLAQAIPRINRLDFIIEKATELGIDALWLFPGEKSERKELSDHQIERCKSIAVAAMKQSGRFHLPEIILKPPLSKWEKPSYALFYGDVSPSAKPFKHYWKEEAPAEGLFFIGPESGFTEAEEKRLNEWEAAGVHLNDNILRTDTAALAAVTLFAHWIV